MTTDWLDNHALAESECRTGWVFEDRVAAALRDVTHDVLAGSCDRAELWEAARVLEEYVTCWRQHLGAVPAVRVAWRLERAGDVYVALNAFPEAARCYLEARCELARLGVEPAEVSSSQTPSASSQRDGRASVIEAKLRAALRGER